MDEKKPANALVRDSGVSEMKIRLYYAAYVALSWTFHRISDALYWLELRLYEPDEEEDETEALGGNPVHIPRVGRGLH